MNTLNLHLYSSFSSTHHSKTLRKHHMGHTKDASMTSWDKEIIGKAGPEEAVGCRHGCLLLEVHGPHSGAHSLSTESHLTVWHKPANHLENYRSVFLLSNSHRLSLSPRGIPSQGVSGLFPALFWLLGFALVWNKLTPPRSCSSRWSCVRQYILLLLRMAQNEQTPQQNAYKSFFTFKWPLL